MLIPLQLASQSAEDFDLSKSIGIDIIPQYTTLMNEHDSNAGDDLKFANSMGFQAGINYTMALNHFVAWRAEAHYASHNQEYTGVMGDTMLVANTNQQFFKPALLLQLSSNRYKKFAFNFYVGPNALVLTSYKDEVEFSTNNVSYGFTTSGKNVEVKQTNNDTTLMLSHAAYTPVDIGIAAGVGVNYNLNEKLALSFNFRADAGMGDGEYKRSKFLNKDGNISNANYWLNYGSKYNTCKNNSFESCPPRPTTTRISAGFHLGLQYKL